jgi:hypothetical protein
VEKLVARDDPIEKQRKSKQDHRGEPSFWGMFGEKGLRNLFCKAPGTDRKLGHGRLRQKVSDPWSHPRKFFASSLLARTPSSSAVNTAHCFRASRPRNSVNAMESLLCFSSMVAVILPTGCNFRWLPHVVNGAFAVDMVMQVASQTRRTSTRGNPTTRQSNSLLQRCGNTAPGPRGDARNEDVECLAPIPRQSVFVAANSR